MKRIEMKLSIDENRFMYRFFRRIVTFALVDYAWLYFRANSFKTAIEMTKKMITDFRPAWFLGFNFADAFESTYLLMTVTFSLAAVMVIDILKYKGFDIRTVIFRQQTVFRWIIYSSALLVILYWGLYGTGYEQTQFIYFQF
ncbi:MAG: hypothetical protein IK139_06150 [Lachnospiraceae bacterium]|nr:hypothetical protein [Lachnospiraceae bacterium]